MSGWGLLHYCWNIRDFHDDNKWPASCLTCCLRSAAGASSCRTRPRPPSTRRPSHFPPGRSICGDSDCDGRRSEKNIICIINVKERNIDSPSKWRRSVWKMQSLTGTSCRSRWEWADGRGTRWWPVWWGRRRWRAAARPSSGKNHGSDSSQTRHQHWNSCQAWSFLLCLSQNSLEYCTLYQLFL